MFFLSFLHFLNDGFRASLFLLFPFISKDLKISLTQVGILGSVIGILSIIVALPSTFIAKKIGSLKTLVLTILFCSIGFFGTSLSPSFIFFIPVYLIAGLGFGLFHPVAFSQVARIIDKKKVGAAMGNYTAIGDVGRIVLSIMLTFLIAPIGWRIASFSYGLLALIAFVSFSFFYLRRSNQIIENKKQPSIKFTKILKNPRFILVIITNVLDNFASSSLFIFLPFLLLKRGINPSILGFFTGAYFLGNFIGKTGLGRFADIFKNTTVFIIAEVSMAISIFFLANSYSPVLILTFSVILGILTQGTVPVRTSMIIEANSHHGQFEEVFAIGSFFSESIIAITPAVLGRVADLYGIVNSFNVAAFIAILATIPAFLFSLSKPAKTT